MNKFERKLKEATAQTTASLLDKLRAWKKDWKRGSLMGSGCFVNITTLGGNHGFEAFLDGEAFDKFVRPAIQQAMEMSLQKKKEFIDYESKSVEIFAEILNNITSSETEDELRYCMKILQERHPSLNRYFSFGFGSTHMWVCEPGSKFRLIFVEF